MVPSRWHHLLAALSVVTSLAARAQSQPAGFELERLQLDPSGLGSLVMPSARLLAPGALRAAAALSYVNHPLVVVRNDAVVGAVVRDRLTLNVTAALGLHRRVEIGAVLPVVLLQLGDDLTQYGIQGPAAFGLGSPWLVGRFNLFAEGELLPFELGAQLAVGIPVGSAEALAGSTVFTLTPKVLASKVLGPLLVGGEIGFDVRPAVPLGVEQYGPQLTVGASVITVEPPLAAVRGLRPELSVRSRIPVTGQLPSLELLAGARLPIGNNLGAFALAGGGLGSAPGTPRFLIAAGVAWENFGAPAKDPAAAR